MSPAELEIGVLLPMWTGALDGATPTMRQVLEYAAEAEAVGLDSVWATDHLYFEAYTDFRAVGIQLPEEYAGVMGGQWECWTTAAAVAAATRRIAVGTLVTNTGFRNPALLARMADTVEDLSEGRLILGLGAGDFATEHRAYGFAFERHVGRFEEALAIICPLLRGEKLTYTGEFHRVEEAELLPKSTTGRTPPILIGTLQGKPRMSRLVAQYADHWNSMIAFNDCSIDTYLRAWAPIAAACEKFDRDPATLTRGATVAVNLTAGPYTIMPTSVPFAGSDRQIADRFAEYAQAGAGHVSVIPQPWNTAGLARLGRVVELLRA
jgi:alkanesulfonate monooxygenase SsuD/methylene tetrahydromethanopterin reductase-like flavin-dependent oxidoreductase (luciferase family)